MQEKNKEAKDTKKNFKVKVWVLLVIGIIVLGVIGFAIWERLEEANCKNTNTNNKGNNSGMIVPNNPNFSQDIAKPIIYLYPEEEINVTVKLGKPENITCSYPKYENGWEVIAKPDGTVTDIKTGRNLYALYWEGIDTNKSEITEGFIVKGSETIKFLEEKLEILGLNEIEAEEFIVYWLPKLQENKYNYVRFATMEEINEKMPLEFSVKPDTLIRVLMEFKGLEEYIEIPEQKLETPERKGFVVVEWGGTEIK